MELSPGLDGENRFWRRQIWPRPPARRRPLPDAEIVGGFFGRLRHVPQACPAVGASIGSLARRCLSKIAHSEPAMAMLPTRNRAGGMTAPGPLSPAPASRRHGRYRGIG